MAVPATKYDHVVLNNHGRMTEPIKWRHLSIAQNLLPLIAFLDTAFEQISEPRSPIVPSIQVKRIPI
jgi:hypothetical protein